MSEHDLAEQLRIVAAKIDKSNELSSALGDRVLLLADRIEKNTDVKLSLRRLLTDLAQELNERERDWRHELVKVGQALAVISKDVDDVEAVTREASVKFAAHSDDVTSVKLFDRYRGSTRFTQTLIAAVVIVALLAGGGGLHALWGLVAGH